MLYKNTFVKKVQVKIKVAIQTLINLLEIVKFLHFILQNLSRNKFLKTSTIKM